MTTLQERFAKEFWSDWVRYNENVLEFIQSEIEQAEKRGEERMKKQMCDFAYFYHNWLTNRERRDVETELKGWLYSWN